MTHWKQNFDYKYTGAYELEEGQQKTVEIMKTGKEEVTGSDGKKTLCFVAYFRNEKKPMVLNKTNCKIISKLYGNDFEKWIGKKITIHSEQVKAFGSVVDALRVIMQQPKEKQIDASKAIEKLNGCRDLNQLQTVYLSLSPEEKTATLELKNELKIQLTPIN
jgi:hypothetical protein